MDTPQSPVKRAKISPPAPRDYQIELLLKAVERNIIVCLGTGTGKTFVSVLLIRELLYQTQPEAGNKKSVFLAPTVPLVIQQAGVIEQHIDAKIGCYYGSETVDSWQQSQWRQEIKKNNVLVMTPQVFSNILDQTYISLAEVNLIIFDECHAATGDHPYKQIMQNHYVKMEPGTRPRILGLTASVLNKKVKTCRVESEIRNLCHNLDSTLATSLEALSFGTRPNEIVVEFRENLAVIEFAKAASPGEGVFSTQLKTLLIDVGPHGALKSLEHRRKSAQHLLDIGLAESSTLNALRNLLVEIDSAHIAMEKCCNQIRLGFISNPYTVIRPDSVSNGEPVGDVIEFSVSPKMERLLGILETFRDFKRDLCCVIFAKERYTVFATWCSLFTLSRKHPERFGFIRPGFVMGEQTSAFKSEEKKILDFGDERFPQGGATMDNFRNGTLNVLVATSVIEEGVDIPQCNLIVRMNESMNLKSYVQCRGRARAKPSIYAILTTEGKKAQVQEEIANFKVAEKIITKYCTEHDMDVMIEADVEEALAGDPDLPTYYANPEDKLNSAIITAQSARTVLQWYCDTLGNDRFQVLRPQKSYETRPAQDSTPDRQSLKDVRSGILLPKASKLFPEEVRGRWLQNKTKALISAALETCKRLHKLDELTENLTPRRRPKANTYIWSDDQVSDEVKELFEGKTIQQKSSIFTKRAMASELESNVHPVLPAKATVYVFRIYLEVPFVDEYSHSRSFRPEDEELCFGLLTFAEDCALNLPDFPIFTRNGREVVRIESLVDVTVTQELWEMCTRFHSYVMKKVCRISRWEFDPLIAPVYVPVRSMGIDFELLQRLTLEQRQPIRNNSVVTCRNVEKAEVSFFVREILNTEDGLKLSLEKIPKNLDFLRNSTREKTKFREHTSAETRAEYATPIAACEVEYLSDSQWSKARTIPVCTHRLNRLLIAERLRTQLVQAGISHDIHHSWPPMVEDNLTKAPDARVRVSAEDLKFIKEVEASYGPSPTDILTALTPLSAQDIVDSERFEVLGDSFLKVAVTLHLFPSKDLSDEGQLTAERCRLISNMNLLALAVPKKLHEAVESRKFSIEDSFRPPGAIVSDDAAKQSVQHQKYKSKICADSVEAMIGVYLERSGPIGALTFLQFLGLRLGYRASGPFLSRFDLSYDPFVEGSQGSVENTLRKHSREMQAVENILGYKFTNRLYLLEAITHQSYRYNRVTRSYERLEFLGDAVIDYLVSCFIYTNNPALNPGQMTSVRSALVCNNQFAEIVTKTNLAKYLLHHSPLLFRITGTYMETIKKNSSLNTLLGEDEVDDVDQVDVPKPFGDLMESLIGAVFIDSGLDFARTWEVFRRLITDQVLVDTLNHKPRNAIQVLGEKFPEGCEYSKVTVCEDNRVEMTLDVDGQHFRVTSRNKKTAKLALAKKALRWFTAQHDEVDDSLSTMDKIARVLELG